MYNVSNRACDAGDHGWASGAQQLERGLIARDKRHLGRLESATVHYSTAVFHVSRSFTPRGNERIFRGRERRHTIAVTQQS